MPPFDYVPDRLIFGRQFQLSNFKSSNYLEIRQQQCVFVSFFWHFLSLTMSFSSVSTVSYTDELGHHEDPIQRNTTLENTYQLGAITFTLVQTLCTAASSPSATHRTWMIKILPSQMHIFATKLIKFVQFD